MKPERKLSWRAYLRALRLEARKTMAALIGTNERQFGTMTDWNGQRYLEFQEEKALEIGASEKLQRRENAA